MEILDELSKATNDISKGELIQIGLIGKNDVSIHDLIKVSYFKTGRLFEASAKCGAILAKKDTIHTFSRVSSKACCTRA